MAGRSPRRLPPRRARRLWLVRLLRRHSRSGGARLRTAPLTTRGLTSAGRRRWYHPRRPTRSGPIGRSTHAICHESATCWSSVPRSSFSALHLFISSLWRVGIWESVCKIYVERMGPKDKKEKKRWIRHTFVQSIFNFKYLYVLTAEVVKVYL